MFTPILSTSLGIRFDGATIFTDIGELISALQDALKAETTVLVKGSRSSRMERVVAALSCSEVPDSEEIH